MEAVETEVAESVTTEAVVTEVAVDEGFEAGVHSVHHLAVFSEGVRGCSRGCHEAVHVRPEGVDIGPKCRAVAPQFVDARVDRSYPLRQQLSDFFSVHGDQDACVSVCVFFR